MDVVKVLINDEEIGYGDYVIAVYIGGERVLYGDEYHDKIEQHVEGFIRGLRYAEKEVEVTQRWVANQDYHYEPPKKLRDIHGAVDEFPS